MLDLGIATASLMLLVGMGYCSYGATGGRVQPMLPLLGLIVPVIHYALLRSWLMAWVLTGSWIFLAMPEVACGSAAQSLNFLAFEGLLSFAASSMLGLPFLIVRLTKPHAPDGHCQECGYNLTGNVSGVCPECGTTIEST